MPRPSRGRQEVRLLVGGRAARSCPWFLNKFSSTLRATAVPYRG